MGLSSVVPNVNFALSIKLGVFRKQKLVFRETLPPIKLIYFQHSPKLLLDMNMKSEKTLKISYFFFAFPSRFSSQRNFYLSVKR